MRWTSSCAMLLIRSSNYDTVTVVDQDRKI